MTGDLLGDVTMDDAKHWDRYVDVGLDYLAIEDDDGGAETYSVVAGLEQRPHVTCLYGILTTHVAEVQKAAGGFGPVHMRFMPTTCFYGEEKGRPYDVVYSPVISPDMVALNAKMRASLEHESTQPEYIPHVTVGYVKAGLGQRYTNMNDLVPMVVRETRLTFSSSEGDESAVDLVAEQQGDLPGHPFRGNQWTEGAVRENAKAYQRDSYLMNSNLRAGEKPEPGHQDIIDGMDKATQAHRFEGRFLYRGIDKATAEALFKPGTDLYDDGFVSTTTDAGYASEFLDETGTDGYVIQIDVGEGTRGLDMNKMFPGSEYDYQKEFVLPRGTGFHVKRVEGRSIHVGLLSREDEE